MKVLDTEMDSMADALGPLEVGFLRFLILMPALCRGLSLCAGQRLLLQVARSRLINRPLFRNSHPIPLAAAAAAAAAP
ncbi:hypothetical protein AXG93_3822s1530 [Marchantia polymorpha subsp. ruderalis]|uniref:Uncharacterized protein n=1 Tax=Marchantia polymorpha subsp. ruderalis TaxID=1480154 RepID=A0A176WM46_MARPO|nr:hypothetical protein AXG93_3822s1530 [Marchantia polymorpha subsp. ruderalis]